MIWSKDRWDEIIEGLVANPFRTMLTAFGVFWGIFILVILLAAGRGLEQGVKKDFEGVATNTMFMWARIPAKDYRGMPRGRRYHFKLGDVNALKQRIPELRYVSPRNKLGGHQGTNNVVRGLKTAAFGVYGDYPEIMNQRPLRIIQGRFVNYGDIQQRRKVAVIGEGVVASLYEEGEQVLGTFIKIQEINFKVVGVYSLKRSNGDGEEEKNELYVPFTTFSQSFNSADRVGWMAITAKDGHSISAFRPTILSLIKERHYIHPEDDRAIGSFDLHREYSKINKLFIALRGVAYFVGILILLSGIIGISNIMLIVVKERTKEIGIRRALGASPHAIRSQILIESLFLTVVSGMSGIVMAALVLYGANTVLDTVADDIMFVNPSVSLGVVLLALFVLVFSGLFAGMIPAQTAIRVKPVIALRAD